MNIYCFWTGDNEMSSNRKECLSELKRVSECNIILVTKENLGQYILPDHPLHPAYQYLSETHKADYLRTYFMNFHGGGYCDIKRTTGSWINSFNNFLTSDYWICGYKEFNGGVATCPDNRELAEKWSELIGNGSYICKPNTPLTNEWYSMMIALLDKKLHILKTHPSTYPRDHSGSGSGSGYPIGWNEMLGQIFHRVSYKYKDRIMNTLPVCLLYNYI